MARNGSREAPELHHEARPRVYNKERKRVSNALYGPCNTEDQEVVRCVTMTIHMVTCAIYNMGGWVELDPALYSQ